MEEINLIRINKVHVFRYGSSICIPNNLIFCTKDTRGYINKIFSGRRKETVNITPMSNQTTTHNNNTK